MKRRRRRRGRAWVVCALVVCWSWSGVRAAAAEQLAFGGLEFLGKAELPRGTSFDGLPVGGLSALAWDDGEGVWLALSDDRAELAAPRVYRLRIDLADGGLVDGDVTVVGALELTDVQGRPFSRRAVDPEGLAVLGDRLFLSSEGEPFLDFPPFVAELGRDGIVRRYFDLPAHFLPRGEAGGIRFNLGFESLGVTPDGRYLFTATENALAQDGPVVDFGVSSLARLLRFDLAAGGAPSEFAYRVEGVRATPPTATAFRINGICDLLPLGADRLVALERQFVDGVGNEARLYRVSLHGATEVSAVESLAATPVEPVAKELLLDFSRLGFRVDNLEGLAVGPRLADGRRVLLVVSDDNFNERWQTTQFLAFAIDPEPATIARIQGAAHRSPLEGRWVFDVEGVVTAIVDRRDRRGFWMESERPDGDPATSEGIFVDWEGAATLSPGRRVRVHGRVAEVAANERQLPVTSLQLEALVELEGEGELAPPVRLFRDGRRPLDVDDDGLAHFDPEENALDLWESLEGMRVEVDPGTVIGATTSYGELVLLPDGSEPGARTSRGGLLRAPAGPPLERAIVSGRLLGELPVLDVGARIDAPVHGVVDYSFSNYKVLATEPLASRPAQRPCADPTTLASDARHLTIGTFNVENLSVAGPAERFERLGRQIVEQMGAPAILALQEVQDDSGPANDGVVTSRATLEALVRGIATAGGPRYEAAWIDPEDGREGGQPGGNIRVALLADRLRAKLERRGDPGARDEARLEERGRSVRLSPTPARVAPGSPAFRLPTGEGVRRSLAAELEVDGRPLFVVVNHWSSKFEDDRDYGARQPPARPTGALREAQAAAIRAWVDELLRLDPAARVVVLGDFNDYEWSPALAKLAAPPLENLVLKLPEPERYTFVFEGAAQAIDHIVVSPSLREGAAIDAVHVNADCADVRRASDHDPLVARLRLRPEREPRRPESRRGAGDPSPSPRP